MGEVASVFRLIVTLSSGELLGPIFVKAENRAAAIACARASDLIEEGERVAASPLNREAAQIDFGSSVIAIGEGKNL
jgi:hypothetical protein